jgi:LmbE family N-acetylglucosaminyl deacetylase|tara:strand:- start:5589 stop:6224 length:636 start_codon:yes stop_codon:yes gene_type:complete
MSKDNILIICSHPDDIEIGMGGTLLKYKQQNKKILQIIFSYGEKSHPHLKKEVIAKAREKEIKKIDKELKRETIFFGLKEGKFKEEIQEKNIKKKIKDLIKKHSPNKIYTLSSSDTHPDHRAVNKIVIEIIDEINYKDDVYAFEVWNIVNENKPVVYIDITETFKEKLNLIKQFKSQWLSVYLQFFPIIFRAKHYGRKNNCKYAERFYKLR